VIASDYATGERVVFGRADAPPAEIGDAVAASCAIPGFYRPVTIAGRRYVDGGVWSTSNLDILSGEELDLVICLNPTSSLHPPQAWNPAHQIAHFFRRASGRVLGSEAKALRATGTKVVLVQPTDEDHAVMGANLMATRNRNRVIEKAIETVGRQLREPDARELLRDLPEGEPHKLARPAGPPETWPRIGARA
jgi:NTE family protein